MRVRGTGSGRCGPSVPALAEDSRVLWDAPALLKEDAMNREGALVGAAALACQRDAFSLPADAHYLNCAYISPLPKAVEAAGIAGIRRKRVPAGLHTPDFFDESDRVRELFARLVGAPDPERIAIIPAVSYAVATAARNLPVGRGQNIVLLHEQFPGNVHAWRRKADTAGAEIRTVRVRRAAGSVRGMVWHRRSRDGPYGADAGPDGRPWGVRHPRRERRSSRAGSGGKRMAV